MNAAQAQWQRFAARFDALKVRERALLFAAAVVGAVLLFDTLALQPLEARKKRVQQQLKESRQNVQTAEAVLKGQQPVADPAAVRRAYRETLRKQLAEIDRGMQGVQRGLVAPERMAKLLEEMLGHVRGLQLVSLRTLPAQRFGSPGAVPAPKGGAMSANPAPKGPERAIYQHSFEIALQGSYVELHDYLAQLEKLPWQMFWSRITVNTEQYPKLQVTLTVQTLSLNQAWLIV